MTMYDIIYKKREGGMLTKEEITFFVNGYTKGDIPDYQASALLMAIHFKGLSKEETFLLTDAMVRSGDRIDLSSIKGVKVDKHSTGGVGDKTTLIVGPLAASCGVPIAKMSGRGLGFTGGTIDKLESIPGFRTSMAPNEFTDHVNKTGIAIIGQTAHVAPADKKLYALRDVTATVDNMGLISGSIMSKKLAAGSDAIVLDVKCGSGAFMKDLDQALELARYMVEIGYSAGKKTAAFITDMDQPLGCAVGNALEVKEAIEVLKGNGPKDITELSIEIAAYMVLLGGLADTHEEAVSLVTSQLKNLKGLEKFQQFVVAQGGNGQITEDLSLLPSANIYEVISGEEGYVEKIKTDDIGKAALALGAGRQKKSDAIDLSAGIVLKKKIGDTVAKGEVMAHIHCNHETKISEAENIVKNAYSVNKKIKKDQLLIKALITKENVKKY
ncbi:MAG: pyrimidine-nucleoside phosphorylase [Clostridia bacterium]|nr:pyrimidine-nucleoside phosphorylase [Clostridia bacterium]